MDFKASMLPGNRVGPDLSCHPVLVPAADVPPPDAEAAEIDAIQADFAEAFGELGSDEIGIASKEVLGWSCSYRRDQTARTRPRSAQCRGCARPGQRQQQEVRQEEQQQRQRRR